MTILLAKSDKLLRKKSTQENSFNRQLIEAINKKIRF